jgi:hypothetical protein
MALVVEVMTDEIEDDEVEDAKDMVMNLRLLVP